MLQAGYASELALTPFKASYDLHKGKRHIATTELKLTRSGEHWRWSSLTTARGIYAWFTRKQPYTETSFSRVDSEFRLNKILIADAGKRKQQEAANFDWGKGQMEVLRKGRRKRVPLTATVVYDYQSIHLLAATMGQRQLAETTIDFYRKGKLVKSSLVYSGRQQLDQNDKSIEVNVYQQSIASSDATINYYYDAANPLLPIRIEKLEAGEKSTILTLRQVDWEL
ncbi:MAG: DUF3108 domain-containing protein [Gammaproteobacteria bacterium]|nr:DUF3108 domain-containing protein [Gammaproteobacteria bacterium]